MAEVESKNKIKGSNNTTAGRDIINNNMGVLEKFICTQLSNELIPKMKEQADSISSSIGDQMHQIIEQEIIHPFREEVKNINLKYHIEEAQKIIDHTKSEDTIQKDNYSEAVKLKRIESLNDWTQQVQNISKDEEELSKIWQGWFMNFNAGDNINDLNLVLKHMKGLTADEAMLLLYLNTPVNENVFINNKDRADNRLLNVFFRNRTNKTKYLYEQLLEKKLIEPNTQNKRLLYVFLACTFFLVMFALIYMPFTDFLRKTENMIYALMFIGVIGVMWIPFITRNERTKYVRTWIGEAIVKYARQAEGVRNT